MIPSAQAYTTKLNELVEMMNSGSFEPDTVKQKNPKRGNCHKNKEKDKETVGTIIKSSPNDITPVELDPAESEELDSEKLESDNEESIGGDSDTSNKTEKSSEEDNAQSHMDHVFALIDSGHNED